MIQCFSTTPTTHRYQLRSNSPSHCTVLDMTAMQPAKLRWANGLARERLACTSHQTRNDCDTASIIYERSCASTNSRGEERSQSMGRGPFVQSLEAWMNFC